MNESEKTLDIITKEFGWNCEGSPVFGWNQKSISKKATNLKGEVCWIKLIMNACLKEWEGEVMAMHLPFSFKPKLISYNDTFFLLTTEYIEEPIFGKKPWLLEKESNVSVSFLNSLKQNLSRIHQTPTHRIHSRFDLVKRRIFERWDISLSENECHWQTIHGDLHWSNLTKNYILDWESWGMGLVGLDAATLVAFSGMYPKIVEKIYKTLCIDIPPKTLALASLFITSELLRMSELYDDHPELIPSLTELGKYSRSIYLS